MRFESLTKALLSAGGLAGVIGVWAALAAIPAPAGEHRSGDGIMDEVFARHHQYPYVYEEQTMVLLDAAGNRDVRRARRYSRIEPDRTAKYLLVLFQPAEVRGVALLVERRPSGEHDSGLYLPAYGARFLSGAGDTRSAHFLGTDFAVQDLIPDERKNYRYQRRDDRYVDENPLFVVEALPVSEAIERQTGYGLRRHYIRQDNFFIVRTDYFDRHGRLYKRQNRFDLRRVSGDMWRANMILMEDLKKRHRTLLKINRRVFSPDYVPERIFDRSWLRENAHLAASGRVTDTPPGAPGTAAGGAGDTGS